MQYYTHFKMLASAAEKGKFPIPVGYFISIKPNNQSFLGDGLFADIFRDATNMIRDYIDNNEMKFSDIVLSDLFASNFTVMGTALKNIQQGYNENSSMKEYLRNKSWYVEYKLSDDMLSDDKEFIDMADFLKRQSQLAIEKNLLKGIHFFDAIDAITVAADSPGRQQLFFVVVMQCADTDACQLCECIDAVFHFYPLLYSCPCMLRADVLL